ncbi:MAG: TPM domain-containing protein [bacterium]
MNRQTITIKSLAFIFIAALALLFSGAPTLNAAQNFPNPTGYVNDYANVMDANTKAQLEQLLVAVKDKTTAEIAVAVVPTFAPYASIDEYAVKLFEAWGIGGKEKDNGVLIVVAIDDRKMRIEVGYGLEGAIPDAAAGAIVSDVMAPRFKTGDFSGGLQAGAEAVVERTLPEYNLTMADLGLNYQAAQQAPIKELPLFKKIISLIFTIFLIILFIRHPSLLLLLLFSGSGGSRGWSSGGGGGFSGGFGGFGGGGSGGGGASGGW